MFKEDGVEICSSDNMNILCGLRALSLLFAAFPSIFYCCIMHLSYYCKKIYPLFCHFDQAYSERWDKGGVTPQCTVSFVRQKQLTNKTNKCVISRTTRFLLNNKFVICFILSQKNNCHACEYQSVNGQSFSCKHFD